MPPDRSEKGDFAGTGAPMSALQAWPDGLFAGGGTFTPARLGVIDGRHVDLDVERWHQPPTPDDLDALDRADGAVLDIGCGPGRHVSALQARGQEALGIDISPAAVRAARRRGANAIVASVWDRLGGWGYWQTALLLDGNIGIGGDPAALLKQTVTHLAGARRVIVELLAGPVDGPITVQVTQGPWRGPWFRWAVVTPATIGRVARASGLIVDELWTSAAERRFALLSPERTAAQPQAVVVDRTAIGPTARDGEGDIDVSGWTQGARRSTGLIGADSATSRRSLVRPWWGVEPERRYPSRLEHFAGSDGPLGAPLVRVAGSGGADG